MDTTTTRATYDLRGLRDLMDELASGPSNLVARETGHLIESGCSSVNLLESLEREPEGIAVAMDFP